VAEQNTPLPISSSKPPEFAPEQQQLFRDVLRILAEHRIPFAVSGAFALHEHTGIWRNTKDLDVFMPAEHVPQSMQTLQSHGLEIEVCDPVWLCKARIKEYFVDVISGMSNAVIRVDESWIQRAFDSEVFGIPVKVLAPEELIASKIFVAFRERFDGADIAHIVYAAGNNMDWRRLLTLAGEHSSMLLWSLVFFQYVYPGSNAVPKMVWDELLAKFHSDIENPDPKATFRGTLLDEKMFAIDVAEWNLPNPLAEYRKNVEAHNENFIVEPAA